MKRLLSTVFVVAFASTAFASSAFAGNSDRYNDLRLDTAVGHVSASKVTAAMPAKKSKARVVFSTSNKKSSNKGVGYAYANPYGVGPHNDSR